MVAANTSTAESPGKDTLRQQIRRYLLLALAAFGIFSLPPAIFLLKFRAEAPFYFLAQDSFYYLSIALHSRGAPFFTINGLYPTNGFHPLWEWLEYLAAKTAFFRLDRPSIVPRLWAADIGIVGTATALFAAYVYRYTRRGWLSIVAVCPGWFWLLFGVGSPAHLNNWTFVNGMETGVELLFFSGAALLFGREFRWGPRFVLGCLALGCTVLSRLDDIFFLAAIAAFAVLAGSRQEQLKRAAAFALPALMIAGYLVYNHHTVGVWLPVSGAAKAGLGYRAGFGETLRLLKGWPFWAMEPSSVAFQYGLTYGLVAQMLGPMAIAAAFLLWARPREGVSLPVKALAVGVLLKGGYNFVVVPLGYQGAWYYGVSIATANLILAMFVAELERRWSAAAALRAGDGRGWSAPVRCMAGGTALLTLAFLSFNVTASRASQYGFDRTRLVYDEGAEIRAAIERTGHPLFLEFQDGELSFATGLPSISGFGLAGDPEAAREQRQGTYFDLLARRGVTIAAASGTYPSAIAKAKVDKRLFTVWGFNREEIAHYRFDPFWTDATGNVVLYRIVREGR